VFEDACSLLDIALHLHSIDSADKAEQMFKNWQVNPESRPECVFVDLNIVGSTFDGIELVRKINYEYGNGCVVGIISSSTDKAEQSKAVQAGAQFWIVKTDDIEPRLEEFKKDYQMFINRKSPFKVYQ
jgi:DNA-binding NarL/FixJ family response regulator